MEFYNLPSLEVQSPGSETLIFSICVIIFISFLFFCKHQVSDSLSFLFTKKQNQELIGKNCWSEKCQSWF